MTFDNDARDVADMARYVTSKAVHHELYMSEAIRSLPSKTDTVLKRDMFLQDEEKNSSDSVKVESTTFLCGWNLYLLTLAFVSHALIVSEIIH